jgi:hypothetical protein
LRGWPVAIRKAQKFLPEQEVRGIVMGVSANFAPYRKTYNDPARGDRLYIEHPMDLKTPGHIAEILVGPLAPTGAEDDVRTLLRAEGFPDAIPIVRSTAA